LVAWEPEWSGIFGGLKPYYYADVHPFFHDLDQLPDDM
jgi:phosphonate transport system substrate-binding protein